MFDDVCMVCGKFLDSGLIYCSDTCESVDRTSSSSPSLSSAASSSAFFPSPYIRSTLAPPDVPPLMLPAAKRISASSSSASSDIASVFEDDYEEEDSDDGKREHLFQLPPLEHDVMSTVRVPRRAPGPLSFARHPSPADNRTLIPILHIRPSDNVNPPRTRKSSASVDVPHSFATSRPAHGDRHAPTSNHRHTRSHDMHYLRVATPVPVPTPPPPPAQPGSHSQSYGDPASAAAKPKRARASLPAYFSHLTLSSQGLARTSPPPHHVHANAGASASAGADAIHDGDASSTPKRRLRPKSDVSGYAEKPLVVFRSPEMPMSIPRSQEMPIPIPRSHDTSFASSYKAAVALASKEYAEDNGERRGRSRMVTQRRLFGS